MNLREKELETPNKQKRFNNFRMSILRVKKVASLLFRGKKNEFILGSEVAIYVVLFSTITIMRYYSFQTYAYDLGIYNQALHTTLYSGKLLYSTPDLMANPSGSLFGIHFSPIFFLILPFYAISPSPVSLLVIQTIALALGAVPMYLLAKEKLGNKWGLVFSTAYLLNPALQGINWYDFHPEAFIPAFVLFSLYFYDAKKMGKYVLFLILALITIEFVGFLFAFLSIYFLLELKLWKKTQVDWTKTKAAIFTLVVSVAWSFLSLRLIQFFNPTVAPMSGEIYWSSIGAHSLLEVPVQAITHPNLIAEAMAFDIVPKTAYVLGLLASTAFLALLEPLIVVCCLPWLSIVFLTNGSPFYSFGVQYTAYIVPFVLYAAIKGMRRLLVRTRWIFSVRQSCLLAASLICVALLVSFVYTPLQNDPLQSYNLISYGIPQISEHEQQLMKLVQLIPENSSVLIQNNIFPPLSNRAEAYLFPSGVRFPLGESLSKELNELLDKVDFVIGDFKTDLVTLPTILKYLANHGNYGIYAFADDALVLKRNFSGPPVLFVPTIRTFDYKSLVLFDGTFVNDSDSFSGTVLMHSRENKAPTIFWGGPYTFLTPGSYEAIFRMKASNFSKESEDLVDLYVSYFPYSIGVEYRGSNASGYNIAFTLAQNETQIIEASRRLNPADFSTSGHYLEFRVNFTAAGFGAYEFRGTNIFNNSDIFLDEIKLIQTKPLPSMAIEVYDSTPI